jgi:ParB/RepB/Spo0J family partition protein
MVSVEDLEFMPGNPRQQLYDETLDELSQSLARDGMIEPIVVRPKGTKYEIVVGERRVRAAIRSNLVKLPAVIRSGLTDEEASRIRLIENMKRKDFTLVEKVEGIKAYMREYNASLDALAKELGVKTATIKGWFDKVENLSPKIKNDIVFVTKLSPDILAIISKYDFKTQEKLAKVITKHELTDWTARRFRDMFESNPEADLDKMAETAKRQLKTIAVTLPVEKAKEVRRMAKEILDKERKASKQLQRHLRKKTHQAFTSAETVQIPYETPALKKRREAEFARVAIDRGLSGNQTLRLEKLIHEYPDTPVHELGEQVQKEEGPQVMVIELSPKVYAALESYANVQRVFIKQAALALIEEGLETHGLWKRRISG